MQSMSTKYENSTQSLNCLSPALNHPPANITSVLWSKVRGNKEDKIFKFKVNTQEINHYKKDLIGRIEFDKTKPTLLSLRNSKMTDGGLYECILRFSENDKDSSYKNYIHIEVTHPPTLIYIKDNKGNEIKGILNF